MELAPVAFTHPYRSTNELTNLEAVVASGHIHGDGPFTASASERLRQICNVDSVLLTTSCTHALEMASLLLDVGPGDEVILPSFTFPSAATAIANYGATPVFVDIDMSSGNVEPGAIEAAITARTKAISVVHYGGVGADMASIETIANHHGLPIIEDNAHALGATWRDRSLGTIGAVGTQSFHGTKNIHSGEGGALLVNDETLFERAEIIREKGTNRSRFLRGQVDKYTWTDVGSSYLMSELNAAVLDSQLEEFDHIQSLRHEVWDAYAQALGPWADQTGAELMSPPSHAAHPAHVFYILMPSHAAQTALLQHLRDLRITATFHYVPLHSSPAGMRFGRTPHGCDNSESFSRRLVRLPLWSGMPHDFVARVIDGVTSFVVADAAAP